ncbi:MAG: hypothetical protein VYC34_03005, partial [Planctomycetota bacterium]|nr:hypothetical protein [Planctomycetota bacterium]
HYRVEAQHVASTSPFIYPAEIINQASPGRAQIQALVRDAAQSATSTFAMNVDMIADPNGPQEEEPSDDDGGGSVGGGGGGGTGGGDDGGDSNPPAGDGEFGLGMNLAGLTYYTSEWVFKDLVKMSSEWATQNATYVPGGQNRFNTELLSHFRLSPEGWPLDAIPMQIPGAEAPQILATLMCRNAGRFEGGTYVAVWEGDGDVDVTYDARVVSRTANRLVAEVTPTNAGIVLKITRSNPANPVRNVRFMKQEYEHNEATQPFHPLYLERLAPFETIRFMDWQRTNNSTLSRWQDRTKPNARTMDAPAGVAVEVMVDLCNELDADAWFCVPHLADENFMRQFARLVRDTLEPGRKVYIEYSNEVWNPLFQAWHYMNNTPYGGVNGVTERYAMRSKNLFEIWQQEFGAQSDRVVRVLGSQNGNPFISRVALQTINAEADVLAVAPYFELHNMYDRLDDLGANATSDQIVEMLGNYLEQYTIPLLHENAALATQFGVELVTYEGGQHAMPRYAGQSTPYLPAIVDAQRHPGMGELYERLLSEFRGSGGRLFTAFNFVSEWGRWGSWGHLERMDSDTTGPSAVKFRALCEAAESPIPE